MTSSQTQNMAANSTRLPRVVIVGAGFGGLRAARALRNAPVEVIVIDKNNHHLFQPLLYQVATAGLSPADISAPIRSILKKQKNTTVLLAEVTGVDAEKQVVHTADQDISYDYLIVATGATHSYFGHDEWGEFAPGLKSIPDATYLRRQILLAFEAAEMESDPARQRELMTFVLVGAGPTGVEMAGAIAELAHKALARDFRNIDPRLARVILVEAMPRIMPVFPEKLADKVAKALTRLGVEVKTNSAVEKIDRDGVVIAGEHIPVQNVIWTAGVAASPAAKWLGAETDRAGRAKVQSDLSLPGYGNVFVVGDTALFLQENGKPLPGIAPVAMQEGDYVGARISQLAAGRTPEKAFQYKSKGNLATVGRSFGIADFGWLRLWGFVGWVLWLAVHTFFLIGFRNRVIVMFQWAWAYLTFQRSARLITFPSAHSLKRRELVEELV